MAIILVVDNNADTQLLYKRILGSEGHEVVPASDGKEGVERFKAGGIDLVILDHAMPTGEDGDYFLRCAGVPDSIPIVSVSAYTEADLMKKYEGLRQPDAYVNIPFEPDSLAGIVKAQLSK